MYSGKMLVIPIEKAPSESGVYLFKSKDKILYIGKARSLKKRLSSYKEPKTEKQALLLKEADNVEWLITDSEIEALILEANLIKEYKPKFNVSLKDSKAYPFIKLTKEQFPALSFSRKIENDGWYFGPYPNIVMKKTIRITKELFKIRGCKNKIQDTGDRRLESGVRNKEREEEERKDTSEKLKVKSEKQGEEEEGAQMDEGWRRQKKPCLAFHINQCLAPCIGKITEKEYQKAVKDALSFLSYRHSQMAKRLEVKMKNEAKRLNFEESAKLRDRIKAIRFLDSKQKVYFLQPIDVDIIASFSERYRVCLLLLSIRAGRLIGEYPFFFENKENLLSGFIEQYYLSIPHIPKEIIINEEIEDKELLSLWLSEKKKKKVKIFVPKRGKKRELLGLCKRNAKELLVRRGEATASIQDTLSLPREPKIIEGIDISNIGGKDAYGAIVVFENGVPNKELYRVFKIKTDTPDDYGMIKEVIKRRYSRLKKEVSRFPDLIVIDGGAGHLNIAYRTLMELGLADIPLVSMAKSPDRCFLLHKKEPILISSAPSLLILSFVRDEAHRFSLSFHRRKRGKFIYTQINQPF
ncbi:MAG: excinuclease ABC subunit UvrC [bacterium]|nr:excinuclease ABC subunit UvrC [bacterium]